MKTTSRLPVLSFVLGIAAWFALTNGGWSALVAIPLGLIAVCGGIAALSSRRPPGSRIRGRALAASAISLGALATLASGVVLIVLFLQQFSPDGGRRGDWGHNHHFGQLRADNGMPNQPAANFTSNLPIGILDTGGEFVSKEAPTVVHAQFFEPENGRASLAGKPSYDGLASIHLRGNSTLHLPKSSYTLHILDSHTNQVKASLLGLPAEADWVLYAPFEDKTMIRDVLAYELAARMGHYAPRTRYLELFVRASGRPLSMRDYVGVYVLVEKIKRGKDRVNIAKLGPDDEAEPNITGGYILKRDHNESPDSRFRTRHGGPYSYVYPKAAEITPEQKRWIKHYFGLFESALYGSDFMDRQTGYAAFLDVNSFIDAHWLIELSKNVDGFRYSSYLTKDRGGKLKTEPPWDWNRSFGNANYYDGGEPKGWYWSNLRPNEINWFRRLREDPEFSKRCSARWLELRKDVLDPKKINRRVDELAAQLSEAQQRNFRRWPILGQQVTCNYYVGNSFQDEVHWLKKWIERRVSWIDGQVSASGNL